MVEEYLLTHPWLPALIWVLLYTSDYYLTLWGARLYKRQSFFVYEGSYELTPQYQEDVDKQKRISAAFIMWLIAGAVILYLCGIIPNNSLPIYGALVGWFLVAEVVVHMRHIDNILTYRRFASPNPGVSGQLTFSRPSIYRRSSVQMACFGVLTLMIYALTESTVFLGGGIGVLLLSYNHSKLARYYSKLQTPAVESPAKAEVVDE